MTIAVVSKQENNDNDFFSINVEALSNDESIPTIPCVLSTSSCSYLVKDALGNTYIANTAGMRNIE